MYAITLPDIAIAFIPVFITLIVIFRWTNSVRKASIALARMLLQLMVIGYALEFIFTADNSWVILAVLCFMLAAASWISLEPLPVRNIELLRYSLIAIAVGGVFNLALITQAVLHADPWYKPAVLIPLAGMIFANSMNSVSLAGERLFSELGHHSDYTRARNTAFQAALIPITNSLLAVGLVSLPGMMTGQILAGTSPLIAARYQIMVMCMIFASAGMSTALFLWLIRHRVPQPTAEPETEACG